MIRILLPAALLALALPAAGAPLIVPGEPAAIVAAAPAKLRLPPDSARRAALPDISAQALATVREANRRANAARAFEATPRRVVIGVVHGGGAPLPTAADLAWRAVPGGFAAQAAITSPKAQSVRLAVSLAGVPTDAEMVFFGSADPVRLEGPVRVGDVRDRTLPWWGPLTEGETQTIEFFLPAGHAPRSLPLAVADAAHAVGAPSNGFTKRLQDIGDSGSCNVDVPCSQLASSTAFRSSAESVAQMVIVANGELRLCTGTLLNDADPGSQVPYFYGANHCFENDNPPYKTAEQLQVVANSLATLWGFEASACGSAQPRSGWVQRSGGAQYLYSNRQSDALFLRLHDTPPASAYYSGWDATAIAVGSSALSVHHPSGDLKKVSQGSVRRYSTPGVGDGNLPFTEVGWSSGTTEGGSSGSALFTSGSGEYLFRGGLWGGTAFCDTPTGVDYYSRFDLVYPHISGFLGSSSASIDYTDLWWNPSESGWGLNLIQHPSRIIFGVWYTYAPDGKRTWFVMPTGQWTADDTYTGPVYQTAGPSFASSSFDASKVVRMPVGSATLRFNDRNSGTFTYDINGVGGSRFITRQPF